MKDWSKVKRNIDNLPKDEHTLGGPGSSEMDNPKKKLKRTLKKELRKNGNKSKKN